MTIRVKLPGGTVANFPDGMPASEIEAVLQKQFPPEAAPDKRSPTDILRGSLANAGSFGTTPQPGDMPEGAAAKLGLAGTIATLPMIPATGAALVAAPVATGKAILGGLIGSAAGTAGGEWVGHKIPIVGGATASKVLGTVGGLVGGVGGAVAAPKMTAGNLLRFAAEGRGGVLQAIFGSGEAKAVSAAREAAVAEARDLRNALLKARLEKTVAGTKALEQRVSDSMRKVAVAEAKEARLAKKAGLSVPDFRAVAAETAPAAAPAAAAPAPAPATVLPTGQRTMPTNLGGAARPSPAPTPPEKLEEALQATLDAMKAKKSGAAAPPVASSAPAGPPRALTHDEAIEAARDSAGRVRWKKVPEPPKDPLGNPILPGQENWTPEQRALARATAEDAAKAAALEERTQPTGRFPVLNERGQIDYDTAREGGNAVGWYGVNSAKKGTAIEGVQGSPKQIVEALKKDKGNPTEMEALKAADDFNQEVQFRKELDASRAARRQGVPREDAPLTAAEEASIPESAASFDPAEFSKPAENLGTLAAGKASGSLQPERVQIGAERVGKPLGMTKEQVRMEAGPVLNEARGTASPLLPKQAYASIAEKIKTLPRGEARDAYVKLANSEKAMWNVEAIRRTLETQGLVLPFAAVAGLVIKAQEK